MDKMTNLIQTLEKIQRDLNWRGPSGKTMGHIVLNRAQAEVIIEVFVSKVVAMANREEDHDC